MVQMNNNLNQNYKQQMNANAMNPYIMGNNQMPMDPYAAMSINPLQRSKSLSSADALTRGIAGLGLGLGNEVTDIGAFPPEIQTLIDTALENPNKLNSRSLMELTSHFIKRAVEGRRYALPISRLCLNIIAKEQKETFLEALLNTCRQWYQEREKVKKQILCDILKIANWIYLLNLLAASVYYTRDEVTVKGTFHRFHGISNGNVLSIEAASIAIANPV